MQQKLGSAADAGVVRRRVLIAGAAGRLGSLVVSQVRLHPALHMAAALVRSLPDASSPAVASQEQCITAIAAVSTALDICIDATAPSLAATLAPWCATHRVAYLSLSTALSADAIAALRAAAECVPVAHVQNAARSVWLLQRLVREARSTFASDVDCAISETHHRLKKDAPSGTARLLARAADVPVESISSVRLGDVVGEHQIRFRGVGEELIINHQVNDRSIFARGAVDLALLLLERTPGLYTEGELFGG